MIYVDAGTTYTKIITTSVYPADMSYCILPTKEVMHLNPDKSCGHLGGENKENEIVALAKGALKYVTPDATVLDLGSRDAKWIKFQGAKFHDMDWNTTCASSTGATVEMLLKFYDLTTSELVPAQEKFPVTCGIFGLEKIMDDISNGASPEMAVSKFIHGIAYNAWTFAKSPDTIYLSGGFCENECFVKSLENYCKVVRLGRFILCEGLIDEDGK